MLLCLCTNVIDIVEKQTSIASSYWLLRNGPNPMISKDASVFTFELWKIDKHVPLFLAIV